MWSHGQFAIRLSHSSVTCLIALIAVVASPARAAVSLSESVAERAATVSGVAPALLMTAGPSFMTVSTTDPGSGSGVGNAPDSTGQPPTSLVRALDRIPATSMIRVQGSNLGLLEGTLERWDVQSLRLGEPTGEREIPLSSVQALWVRGRATGHGAKVGAIIAGIVGAVAGAATVALGRGIAEGGGPDGLRGSYLGMAAVGAVAGGGIGALVGAGVGRASPRWNRRFQHER